MKKLYFFIPLVVMFGLNGCAAQSGKPSVVIMQHPETIEFVNCKVDEWGTADSYAKNEKCVEDLKKQGFVVWAER